MQFYLRIKGYSDVQNGTRMPIGRLPMMACSALWCHRTVGLYEKCNHVGRRTSERGRNESVGRFAGTFLFLLLLLLPSPWPEPNASNARSARPGTDGLPTILCLRSSSFLLSGPSRRARNPRFKHQAGEILTVLNRCFMRDVTMHDTRFFAKHELSKDSN